MCDCWYFGLGFPKDIKTAFDCFKREDPLWAVYMMDKGEGVTADRGAAIRYLEGIIASKRFSPQGDKELSDLLAALKEKKPVNRMGIDTSKIKEEEASPKTWDILDMLDDLCKYNWYQNAFVLLHVEHSLAKEEIPILEKYKKCKKDYIEAQGEMVGFFYDTNGSESRIQAAGERGSMEEEMNPVLIALFNLKAPLKEDVAKFASADKELNETYKWMNDASNKLDRENRKEGESIFERPVSGRKKDMDEWKERVNSEAHFHEYLQKAELEWIKYRDASVDLWVAFHKGYLEPRAVSAYVKTILTQERTKELKDLANEDPNQCSFAGSLSLRK